MKAVGGVWSRWFQFHRRCRSIFLVIAVLLMAACSTAPPPITRPVENSERVTPSSQPAQSITYPLKVTASTPLIEVVYRANKPSNAVTATLMLRVWGADFSNEGELRVNGNAPITLFGSQTVSGNVQHTVTLEMPASHWNDGNNTLSFRHLQTYGYWVSGIEVAFSAGTPAPTPPENPAPPPTNPPPDSPSLQPINYPLKVTTSNPVISVNFPVNKPSGATTARLTLKVWGADVADEGTLTINGHSPIVLFGNQRISQNVEHTVVFEMLASHWNSGDNTLTFRHLRTFGYWISGISVSFITDNTAPTPPDDPPPPANPPLDSPPLQPLNYPLRVTSSNPVIGVNFPVNKPSGATTARLTLRVWGADVADEGSLTINGHSPIMLFGNQRISENIEHTVVFEMPASHWNSGDNTLIFRHLRTYGYWISWISVSFSGGSSAPQPPGGLSERFTIVVIPDTQNYLCSICPASANKWHPAIFRAQTQWIVDKKDPLNIAFVTHLGDVVETADRRIEWEEADRAMRTLDGVVPYSVTIGDHDYFPEEYRDPSIPMNTTYFKEFFGASRYQNYSWYLGTPSHSLSKDLSHAQLFSAGGRQFLHIALEWEAPNEALNWAAGIIQQHPGVPTIVSTHAYLSNTRQRRETWKEAKLKDGSPDPRSNSGEDIYRKLIREHPQIFMVLGAHYHDYNKNLDINDEDGEWHQISQNRAGSNVYEMLSNYQDFKNGGDGWLRTIEFIPGGGANGLDRMQMRTYSPTRDQYRTGSLSQFYFDFNFAARFNTP
jgi:hypothetical protein